MLESNNFVKVQKRKKFQLFSCNISSSSAKKILAELITKGGKVSDIIGKMGLSQNSDPKFAEKLIKQMIAENPRSVEEFRNGKTNALNHIIGLCMKASKGRANPAILRQTAENYINNREE